MAAARSRWYSYTFMLINTVVWALAFIIVKPSLEVTTPFRYLFYRFVLASVLALPILIYYIGKIKISLKLLGTIIGIELIGSGIALALLYWGLEFTTAIEANLLTSSAPIFITLGGILLLHEKEEKHEWWGLAIASLGALVLTLIPVLTGESSTLLKISLLGNLLILASNFCNMFYFPLAKKYYAQIPKFFAASVSFIVAMVVFGILSVIEVGSVDALSQAIQIDLQYPSVVIAAVYMAVFGSIIGLTTYLIGQNGIEASEASLFAYLSPFIYLPLGVLILKEPVTWWHILGLVLTMVGVFLAEHRFRRSKKSPKKGTVHRVSRARAKHQKRPAVV